MPNLYCEQCRMVTPHVEKAPRATKANPTFDQNVDLTGRGGEASARPVTMSEMFMSEMHEYTCTRCGNNVVNAGVTPASSDGDFGALMRGDDWRPPPEPKG